MIQFLLTAFFLVLAILLVSLPTYSSTRTALVIGNSAYRTSPLSNPTNDASDMAATLKKLGFDVIIKTNADKREMLDAIDLFNQKLRRLDTGLFFFAGHGMQIRGSNYLIPVDVHIQRERDVEFESVNAGRVLAAMEDSGSMVNIVILDACRDNPFKRSFRSTNRGLSIMQVSGGSFVAYATSPGSVAADGEGRNGIYTRNILKHITHPELTVEEVFRKVRKDVYSETNSAQLPWDSSSLMGSVYIFGIDNSDMMVKYLMVKLEEKGKTLWCDAGPEGRRWLNEHLHRKQLFIETLLFNFKELNQDI